MSTDAGVEKPEQDADTRAKVRTRLVERPREETWWHGLDCIAPVPQFSCPAVSGSRVCVIRDDSLYVLDARFDYASVWEARPAQDTLIGIASAPCWSGAGHVGVAALLGDGRYQAIFGDVKARDLTGATLMKGEVYREMYMFEDRYPLAPIALKQGLFIIDPYGHYISSSTGTRGFIGRSIRIRWRPCLGKAGDIVVHVSNSRSSWLEWRSQESLALSAKSERYPAVWTISHGHVGSAPQALSDGSTLCGFGDRLVRFAVDRQVLWEFRYPRLDARDPTGGIRVYSGAGAKDLVYESTSEVNISSDLHQHGSHLYFVLTEGTRHMTYVVKMDWQSGEVIWTSRIEGFSGQFSIVAISDYGLLLQHDRWLWVIAEDGSQREAFELDFDGTSCSELTSLEDDKYVVSSNLGLHEVSLNMKTIEVGRRAQMGMQSDERQVFLSHASEDKDAIVRRFYEACERNGISAWYDAAEIRWGDSLVTKVEQGLATSKIVLLFLSKDFLRKPWPEKELNAAISMEISGRSKVLPLVLGLEHDELVRKHPFVASKLYRLIGNYNPKQPVPGDTIEQLVRELQGQLR